MKSERGMSGGSARPWAARAVRLAPTVRLGLVLLALGAAARAGFSQCNYELLKDANGQPVIVQAPPCPFTGPPATIGTGMSANGNVVGYYHHCSISGAHWGFFWSLESGFVTLPKPANVFAMTPSDVTDAGLVVGTANITGVGNRGFLYDINNPGPGNYLYLPPKNGVGDSWANAINESNVVAGGRSIGASGINPFNAVIWRPYEQGAPVEDLGTMGVGPNSRANAINDTGTSVVGWTGNGGDFSFPFRRDQDGNIMLLGPSYGVDVGFPFDVTNDDIVVGSAIFEGQPARGFIWQGKSLVLLQPLPGFNAAGATYANELGQILGRSTAGAANQKPTLWQHGKLFDLTTLVIDAANVSLREPVGINDDGMIALRALVEGKNVAVLLVPVERPVTDLNADCTTNVHDLMMLLDSWGPCSGCSADFNNDGRVDVRDLLILLSNWG